MDWLRSVFDTSVTAYIYCGSYDSAFCNWAVTDTKECHVEIAYIVYIQKPKGMKLSVLLI